MNDSKTIKLSVVIACYNAEDTIAEQMEALAAQQWDQPWEVIVADNRCTDRSMDVVRQYQERVCNLRIVDASGKQGQAYALNVGVNAARGEGIALCDADDQVGENWVAIMGRALSEHDFVTGRIECLKLNPSPISRALGCQQQEGPQKYGFPLGPKYLPHAAGCNIGFKRNIHQALGGFNEELSHLHDTDFSWRVQLLGIPLHYEPAAVIHYRRRSNLKNTFRQARGYAHANVLLYKRFRKLGMPSVTWGFRAKVWAKLLRDFLIIRSTADLVKWIWQFGWRIGQVQGSIKHRVFVP